MKNNVIEILKKVKKEDSKLVLNEGALQIKSKKTSIDPELLQSIKANKEDIIAYLERFNNRRKSSITEFLQANKLETSDPIPLSFGQERLWFIDQLQGSTEYHMPGVFYLKGKVDCTALEASFKTIITRHEVLRTTITSSQGEGFQTIMPADDWSLEIQTVSETAVIDDILSEYINTPFDLSKDYMLRGRLYQTGEQTYILVLVMHHIASDGWSNNILIKEFVSLYSALKNGVTPTLPHLQFQYKEYAFWQRSSAEEETLQDQLQYWESKLENVTPVLVPTDFPRPSQQSTEGAVIHYELKETLKDKLIALCEKEGVTLFMTLITALKVVLHKYTGQEDICIGTPIANRTHQELEGLIGFFINTLALRTTVNSQADFKTVLQDVKETTLEAYDHQMVPFEKVVDRVVSSRDMSMTPVFQVMFVLQNTPDNQEITMEDVVLTPYEYGATTAQFDISLTATETQHGISLEIEYGTAIFKEETMRRMFVHFENVLHSMVSSVETAVAHLSIISKEEKYQLLQTFNDTAFPVPQDQTILNIFKEQVEKTPDAIALIYEHQKLTYRELDEKSNQLANYLIAVGVEEKSFVGICISRSIEMIIGIIGILKSGNAYIPIDPSYPAERIAYMIEDSGIQVVVSSRMDAHLVSSPKIIQKVLLDDDWAKINAYPMHSTPVHVMPDTTAYVIYTSGTTGKPKGVEVGHASLYNISLSWEKEFELDSNTRLLQMASFSFDAFTGDVCRSLLFGGQMIICSNDIRFDLEGLYALIAERKTNVIELTPSLGVPLMDHIYDNKLDFSWVKILNLGSDTCSSIDFQRIQRRFGDQFRIINSYGVTEVTVDSSYYEIKDPAYLDDLTNVPIGKPMQNTCFYIVDPALNLLPVGVVGELCIGGAGLAKGYLNRPELTRDKFVKNPYASDELMYRTGDLARWLPDGNVDFIGRGDDQVKIRGYRIELGEIENVLIRLEAVSACCVLAKKDSAGSKRLVGYVVTKNEFDKAYLEAHLKANMPEYMVPALWVPLEEMPLTSNGKLDKRSLPNPDASALLQNEYVAPRNETESVVADIWKKLLQVTKVGVTDDFFTLGGHSLMATRLVSMIRNELGVEIAIKDIFVHPTIEKLTEEVISKAQNTLLLPPLEPQVRETLIPLSFSQERLWFLDQLQGSLEYHIPEVFRLKGKLDATALELTLKGILSRHEVLRTVIQPVDGVGYQKVLTIDQWEMTSVQVPSEETLQQLLPAFISQPFDLSKDYMLRACLYRISEEEHILSLVMHHIANDGWSDVILVKDFVRLYDAYKNNTSPDIEKLPLQYIDYAIWQRKYLTQDILEQQLSYWEACLSNTTSLALPTDYTRPAIQSTSGAIINYELDAKMRTQLLSWSKEHGVTLFMTMLSAFKVMLYRYSGQEDICVGTPIANRTHQELEGLIGFFINTLALRSQLDGHGSFEELVNQVKQVTLGAYDHQLVPFEKVVDRVVSVRDMSTTPLFQVMFVLQNTPDVDDITMEGVTLSQFEFETITSQFDISLTVTESEKGISLEFEYCTDLFKEDTIHRMIRHYENILKSVVQNTSYSLLELPMLSEEEKEQLVTAFNPPSIQISTEETICDLFRKQVLLVPDKVAVVYKEHTLTYQELDQKSNQLAQLLLDRGVSGHTMVGICLSRSVEMIVSVLAVLKSGGGYVPIDPEYPEDRINYMIEDAGIHTLLSTEVDIQKVTSSNRGKAIILDLDQDKLSRYPTTTLSVEIGQEQTAYVIYTSGTTGRPKGVAVSHGGVYNIAHGWLQAYSLDNTTCLLQMASFSFDVFTGDLCRSLLSGGTMIICPTDIRFDPPSLYTLIATHQANIVELTPALAVPLMDHIFEEKLDFSWMKLLILGSDVCTSADFQRLLSRFGKAFRIINSYGTTETTIDSSFFETTETSSLEKLPNVPIGKPMQNTKFYVLDSALQLLPIGVIGELCIGGEGVAIEYLNRPELTAEKFVSDPFDKGKRMYRTGDLARWLPDGNIDFIGRGDNQVKIRGYRIELGEIEKVLVSHESVKSCCVVAKPDPGGNKRLIGYVVTTITTENKEILQEYLKETLPEYMVPMIWVFLEEMPLTNNGKLDKKALPDPDTASLSTITYVAARNEQEETLVTIWQDLLQVEKIGVHDNFFELGGHSLLATRLVSVLRKSLSLEVAIKDVFLYPTIADLGRYLLANTTSNRAVLPSIEKRERTEFMPLSFSQERLWFLDQLQGSLEYHIPEVFTIHGDIDFVALEKSLREIIERHEVLRTVIRSNEGVGYQKQIAADAWSLECVRLKESETVQEAVEAFIARPFDLSSDYMLRGCLYEQEGTSSVLALVIHHISSDGWSDTVLFSEFSELYRQYKNEKTPNLSDIPLQYVDYAVWQREYFTPSLLEAQLSYWTNSLEGITPLLLPTDFSRPSIKNTEGSALRYTMDAELTSAINRLAKESGTTLFMVLLASFKVLLYKYTSQENICVGTPIANRTHQELEGLIGFFVNTLALHTPITGTYSFLEYLQKVKEVTLGAYEHQSVPFEKVVDRMVETRDMSMNQLFQVMFVLQNTPEAIDVVMDDITLTPFEHNATTSQFDVTLIAIEKEEELIIELEYCTALFKEETMHRFLKHYENVLRTVTQNVSSVIGAIEIISREEKTQLLQEFNNTSVTYPLETTIIDLFSEQVNVRGQETAVILNGERITYEVLDQKSNQLANYLIISGVQQGALLGVCMSRSLEMIVGILGILKAGAGYLPIDPSYPSERIMYMLEDADVRTVLGNNTSPECIKTISKATLLLVDSEWETIEEMSMGSPEISISSEDIAYAIYTSGSTGKPKGTLIPHRGVVRLSQMDVIPLGDQTTILQLSSVSFDAATFEIWCSLLQGGTLVLYPSDIIDLSIINESISRHNVNTIWLTSALFDQWANSDIASLKLAYILSGGDVLNPQSVAKVYNTLPSVQVVNGYGPTENTTFTCCYTIPRSLETNKSIPLGPPISGTTVYVLDENMQSCPVGVIGELCTAGLGVSTGYLNQPELTAEKFVANPFNPQEKMYKTGDLVRWQVDGTIEFIGRRDTQVKIRGFRIELSEIENCLSEHTDIKGCCVLVKEDEHRNKRIVAYIVMDDSLQTEVLKEYLKSRLPDYMIPAIWVPLQKLPLTANGKLDKKALPDPDISTLLTSKYIAPETELEIELAQIWQELLGASQIGIEDNFFELGGDSIITIQLVSRIKRLGYTLKPKDIFEHQTIASLAEMITNHTDLILGEQGLLRGESALLPIQQWYFDEVHVENKQVFNQSVLMEIDKGINEAFLERAVEELVLQHDALRFAYTRKNEGWKQDYTDRIPSLLIENLQEETQQNLGSSIEQVCNTYQNETTLDKEHVFAVVLIKTPSKEKNNRLFLVAHHLVIDGVSWRILLDDMQAIINALKREQTVKLGAKSSSYREWVTAMQKIANSQSVYSQLSYWKSITQSYRVLPTDYKVALPKKRKDVVDYTITLDSKYTSMLLQEINQVYATEINDILLSCLSKTIGKWSSHSKIVIGMEGHGREVIATDIDVSNTVGWFTSLYPVCLSYDDQMDDGTLIKSTKEELRLIPDKGIGYGALKYLHPSDEVREVFTDNRWDIVFNYLGQLDNTLDTIDWLDNAKESSGIEIAAGLSFTSKLEINASISSGQLLITWSYASKEYKESTIAEIALQYITNLQELIMHCLQKENQELTPSDYGLEKEVSHEELDAFFESTSESEELFKF
ncbi:amino acid adenylation domain-containing protein [Aquimarina hainanensis]|uniref:Amino acid adenylation domain-containing protein n=1 Tax=Aquimarina hainanensis TaxID=1578017 RepID=A0ABW5N9D1_9FLAO